MIEFNSPQSCYDKPTLRQRGTRNEIIIEPNYGREHMISKTIKSALFCFPPQTFFSSSILSPLPLSLVPMTSPMTHTQMFFKEVMRFQLTVDSWLHRCLSIKISSLKYFRDIDIILTERATAEKAESNSLSLRQCSLEAIEAPIATLAIANVECWPSLSRQVFTMRWP